MSEPTRSQILDKVVETFDELEVFLARERGRLRRFGIGLFLGGIVSIVTGAVLIYLATQWAGPFMAAVGFCLVGVGLVIGIRAAILLFTKKDEMVGLHLTPKKEDVEK